MKKIVFLMLAALAAPAFAEPEPPSNPQVTPRMGCRLVKQTLLAIPFWRGNNVPLPRIQGNVQRAADKAVGFSPEEKSRWVDLGNEAFAKNWSEQEISAGFNTDCEQIPASPGDIDYAPQK